MRVEIEFDRNDDSVESPRGFASRLVHEVATLISVGDTQGRFHDLAGEPIGTWALTGDDDGTTVLLTVDIPPLASGRAPAPELSPEWRLATCAPGPTPTEPRDDLATEEGPPGAQL